MEDNSATTKTVSTINHELNQYDYSEGIEFIGLMPEVMKADGVETIGGSEKSVKHFGFEAKGMDALEVIDIEAFYGSEEGGSEGGNEGGEEGGDQGGDQGGDHGGDQGGDQGGDDSGNTQTDTTESGSTQG